jgi:hypothetical protein
MMTSKLFEAPKIDSATIDYYLARSRRERSRAIAQMIRSVFSTPGQDGADVHELAAYEPPMVPLRAGPARSA